MSYLSASEIARIRAAITRKTAQLEIANSTYERVLAQDTAEYRFNSGEGAQSAVRVRMGEIKDQIETLEAEIAALNRQLSSGSGLVTITLRRQ